VNEIQAEEKAKQEAEVKVGEAGQDAAVKDASWRVVLRRALGALGYLILRWRTIYPPI